MSLDGLEGKESMEDLATTIRGGDPNNPVAVSPLPPTGKQTALAEGPDGHAGEPADIGHTTSFKVGTEGRRTGAESVVKTGDKKFLDFPK